MPNLVKFKTGMGTPSPIEAGVFYISADQGVIYLDSNKWYAGGTGFVSASVSTATNQLSVTFTRRDGTTSVVPVLKGINGDASTVVVDNNGDITVNVVLSTNSKTTGDGATAGNLIINDGDGLFATINADYTDGVLQLKYWNGTAWANVGDAVNIYADSFLTAAKFFTSDQDPGFSTWWQVEWGTAPTFSTPSIIMVMENQTAGSTTTFSTIIIPVDDLYTQFVFSTTNTVAFATASGTNATTVTANVVYNPNAALSANAAGLAVALSSDANNSISFGTDGGLYVLPSEEIGIEDGETVNLSFNGPNLTAEVILTDTPNSAVALSANASGLTVGLTLAPNTATVALNQGTTGLSANVILDPTQDNTVALSATSGLKAALNTTVSATNTVALSKGASGLSADVTIDANGAISAAGGNGIAVLTGTNVAANDSGINLFTNSTGLYAELVWGSF